MTLSRKITQWMVASKRACNRCPPCGRNIVDWVVARLSVIFFLIPTKHDTLVYRSEIRSGWRNSPSQNHTWRSTTIQHLSQILLPHHSEENGIWMNLERPKVVPWEQIGNSMELLNSVAKHAHRRFDTEFYWGPSNASEVTLHLCRRVPKKSMTKTPRILKSNNIR